MRLPVLIPAYNPTEILPGLIQDLIRLGFVNIIVVNDGSSDGCNDIFAKLQKFSECTVLHHAANLGKGAALKTGFNHILLNDPESQAVITADADGQHSAQDILKVAQASLENPGNLVLGIRKFGRDVPLRSRVGNQMTRLVTRLFTGLNLSDTQTGLRAWPRELCRNSLQIPINGYDFEMECLIRAKNRFSRKLKFVEIPIQTIYEDGNKSSNFNPLLDSLKIYFVFIRYCGVSITVVLVDYLLFATALSYLKNVGWSMVIGRGSAFAVGFFLNKTLVFHYHKNGWYSFFKYLFSATAFGIITFFSISYLNGRFGFSVIIAKAFIELLLFFFGFAVVNLFVFNSGEDSDGT
jgi:glycosyltransferase involved in cell wall biosynthesis